MRPDEPRTTQIIKYIHTQYEIYAHISSPCNVYHGFRELHCSDNMLSFNCSTWTPVPKHIQNGSEEGILPAAVVSGAPMELQARTVRYVISLVVKVGTRPNQPCLMFGETPCIMLGFIPSQLHPPFTKPYPTPTLKQKY